MWEITFFIGAYYESDPKALLTINRLHNILIKIMISMWL